MTPPFWLYMMNQGLAKAQKRRYWEAILQLFQLVRKSIFARYCFFAASLNVIQKFQHGKPQSTQKDLHNPALITRMRAFPLYRIFKE